MFGVLYVIIGGSVLNHFDEFLLLLWIENVYIIIIDDIVDLLYIIGSVFGVCIIINAIIDDITRVFGVENRSFNGKEVFIIIDDIIDDIFGALLLLLCILNVILFVLIHKLRKKVILFVLNHKTRTNVIIFVFDHSYHKQQE